MGNVRQLGSGAALTDDGTRSASPAQSSLLAKVAYSVTCGAFATVVGAGVSLVVARADRVVVWCAVAGAASASASVMWHSGVVNACRQAFARWLAAASSS